jgi:hypothetical protein
MLTYLARMSQQNIVTVQNFGCVNLIPLRDLCLYGRDKAVLFATRSKPDLEPR